jgi:hypothetical protein
VTLGGWAGAYGGTVCLENGSTYGWTGSGSVPGAQYGWVDFRSAKAGDAICPNAGDPGGATIVNDLSSRSFWSNRTKFSYVNFKGAANTQSPGSSQYLVADHVNQLHDTQGNGGIFGNGGWMCLESKSFFGGDGLCSAAVMVRGSAGKYAPSDGLHQVPVAVGNTTDGTSNAMEWMTGRYDGTNVIKDVTILPPELSGYKISDILNLSVYGYTLQRTDMTENNSAFNCFSGTTNTITIDDVNHTLTMGGLTGSGNCPVGYVGYLFVTGNHPDAYQLPTGDMAADIYVANNVFSPNNADGSPRYRGFAQGLYLENYGMSSVYVGHNTVNIDRNDGEKMYPTTGNGEAFISDSNVFDGSTSYGFDAVTPDVGYTGETFVGDQCVAGTFAGVGSPRHSKAAATNACYAEKP